jgi:hypothetical protein
VTKISGDGVEVFDQDRMGRRVANAAQLHIGKGFGGRNGLLPHAARGEPEVLGRNAHDGGQHDGGRMSLRLADRRIGQALSYGFRVGFGV